MLFSDIHKKTYFDNTFLCYPVLLRNFDPANEEMMNDFLITTAPFAESPFDYLVLLVTNDTGEVVSNAVKFPKKVFRYISDIINLGVKEDMDPLASPYPIGVTKRMLDCFYDEYILQEQQPANIGLSRIADIGQELWIYSKNYELLTEKEDKQYLSDNLNTIKSQIEVIVKEIESSINNDVLSTITELCKEVYDGNTFDDKMFNELISYIQLAST